jgi:hypothetical protein
MKGHIIFVRKEENLLRIAKFVPLFKRDVNEIKRDVNEKKYIIFIGMPLMGVVQATSGIL